MNRYARLMIAMAIGLGLASLTWAQGVNFSGNWARDKEKSDPLQMRRGGPDAGGGGQAANIDVTLVIKQTDNDLQVTRKMSRDGQERVTEQKFTLDGKENTNPTPAMGRGTPGEFKSKTKLSQNKVVTEGTQKVNTPNGEFEISIKEEYSLSADGKVLTISTTRSTPMGEQTSKQVYTKQ